MPDGNNVDAMESIAEEKDSAQLATHGGLAACEFDDSLLQAKRRGDKIALACQGKHLHFDLVQDMCEWYQLFDMHEVSVVSLSISGFRVNVDSLAIRVRASLAFASLFRFCSYLAGLAAPRFGAQSHPIQKLLKIISLERFFRMFVEAMQNSRV